MNHYCTLFDSGYLTRGLALYRSLVKTHALAGEEFKLAVYCFDDAVFETLKLLNLKNLLPVSLSEFETPELLKIEKQRSRGEYCWTCTPHIIADSLKRFSISETTYLDSDLFFYASPTLLLEEFHKSGASVLITEHRYSAQYDQALKSGIYCVQFMTFKNNSHGMTALKWWGDRCLEWCFARHEDGKFGDQKYLDDWTTRFQGVHVLQHLGGGVAPWNVQQYKVGATSSGNPSVNDVPVVFYHFHHLKWQTDGTFVLAQGYKISDDVARHLYQPYLEELKTALSSVRKIIPGFDLGKVEPEKGVLAKLRKMKRGLYGVKYELSE